MDTNPELVNVPTEALVEELKLRCVNLALVYREQGGEYRFAIADHRKADPVTALGMANALCAFVGSIVDDRIPRPG